MRSPSPGGWTARTSAFHSTMRRSSAGSNWSRTSCCCPRIPSWCGSGSIPVIRQHDRLGRTGIDGADGVLDGARAIALKRPRNRRRIAADIGNEKDELGGASEAARGMQHRHAVRVPSDWSVSGHVLGDDTILAGVEMPVAVECRPPVGPAFIGVEFRVPTEGDVSDRRSGPVPDRALDCERLPGAGEGEGLLQLQEAIRGGSRDGRSRHRGRAEAAVVELETVRVDITSARVRVTEYISVGIAGEVLVLADSRVRGGVRRVETEYVAIGGDVHLHAAIRR